MTNLSNFNIDHLDWIEKHQYDHFTKTLPKATALQIIINTAEGDYSQLSEGLAEIAQEQDKEADRVTHWDYDENGDYNI